MKLLNTIFSCTLILLSTFNILAMDHPITHLQIALIIERYIIPNRNDMPLTHTENGTLANSCSLVKPTQVTFSTTEAESTDILGTLHYDPRPGSIYHLYFISNQGKQKDICCQGTYIEQHMTISVYLKSLNQIIKNHPQTTMIAIKGHKSHFKVPVSSIDQVITQFNSALNDYFYPCQK